MAAIISFVPVGDGSDKTASHSIDCCILEPRYGMPLGKHEDVVVVLSFLLGIKHLQFTLTSGFVSMSTPDLHDRVTVNVSCGGEKTTYLTANQ